MQIELSVYRLDELENDRTLRLVLTNPASVRLYRLSFGR